MQQSIQRDLPSARINITLDLETGGTQEKKELPCKLLALGDFSGGSNHSSLNQRQRHTINRNNFDQVIRAVEPRLNLTVSNQLQREAGELSVDLEFSKLRDFHPDELIMKVPVLRKLLAMRNLLKDFKSNLMDSKMLRAELQKIITDPEKVQFLHQELSSMSQVEESCHE